VRQWVLSVPYALRFLFASRPAILGQVLGIDFRSDREFDLVLCLQVLEHLREPARFSRKLLSVGRRIILSVPYKWPWGVCPSHLQDPVDEQKLLRWLGKPPLEGALVTDGACRRLVAVYEGNKENLV
jgi:hypothetical protein